MRAKWIFILTVGAVFATTPASAEPITLAIAAVFQTIGLSATAAIVAANAVVQVAVAAPWRHRATFLKRRPE